MTMNMEPVEYWDHSDIFMLFIMWTIMMAGMMLPSAIPVVLWVDKLNQQRKARGANYTHSFYFVLGYLIVWTLYSLLLTAIQYWLHQQALLTLMMDSANLYFSSFLLIAAGIYQGTSYKENCLQLCRSPLSMLTTHWREGIGGAINLGFKHGQYCLGCCWFLMSLLFVTGVMNLTWIIILTLLVITEKSLPQGLIFSKILGVGLLCLGFSLLFF
jgi:predicted metal-binding membrane protein